MSIMTEVEFKNELYKIFGNEVKLSGRFKNLSSPIMLETKYGLVSRKRALDVLKINKVEPTFLIKCALNKTEFFMNMLKEAQPEIYEQLIPMSEYKRASEKMLFKNKYGIVSISPDNLIHGHLPGIRTAINRKEYFKNQLLELYDNKYDFIVDSTDRHKGKVILVCPTHGEVSVDTDGIFCGHGCPICNKGLKISDVLYVVKLSNDEESFYKLGVSHYDNKDNIVRFKLYKSLGYNVEIIITKKFNSYEECFNKELQLKRLIKGNTYTPKNWTNKTSSESFYDSSLEIVLNNI